MKLEALGGHTITRHVAQGNAALLRRLDAEKKILGATTFETIRDAEYWVGKVLEVNRATIANATKTLKVGDPPIQIIEPFGQAVGRGFKRGSQTVEYAENVTVRLVKNKFDQLIVLTAFPSF